MTGSVYRHMPDRILLNDEKTFQRRSSRGVPLLHIAGRQKRPKSVFAASHVSAHHSRTGMQSVRRLPWNVSLSAAVLFAHEICKPNLQIACDSGRANRQALKQKRKVKNGMPVQLFAD